MISSSDATLHQSPTDDDAFEPVIVEDESLADDVADSSPDAILSTTTTTTTTSSTAAVNNSSNSPPNVTTTSQSQNNPQSSLFECNICFDSPQDPVVTRCGHIYCWHCIYQWLHADNAPRWVCPVCKSGVKQEELIPIYGRGEGKRSTSASSNATRNTNTTAETRNEESDSEPTIERETDTIRGASSSSSSSSSVEDSHQTSSNTSAPASGIPNRPTGQRSEPAPNPNYRNQNGFAGLHQSLFGGGFMTGSDVNLFPLPFFGLSFGWGNGMEQGGGTTMGAGLGRNVAGGGGTGVVRSFEEEQREYHRQFLKRALLFTAFIVMVCIFSM